MKTNPDIPVTENVVYGTAGEVPLVLDICFHPEAVDGAAGGNLAALIGVDGSGLLTTGSRVATVAELSGPSKLTAAGLGLGTTRQAFQQVELDYLGCAGFGDCPQARAASPRYHVDESDPLFFIGQSLDERIPKPQSDALVAALRKVGVDTNYVTVKGDRHSIAMLTPELRSRIVASLHTQLGN